MGQQVTEAVDSLLLSVHVPDRYQSAVQKAVGMFRACLAAPEDKRGIEMRALKDFMVSLDMDLVEPGQEGESPDPNPGRDMVSLARSDEAWLDERALLRFQLRTSYYTAVVAHYSGRAPSDTMKALVSELSALEDEVQKLIINEKARLAEHWTSVPLKDILAAREEQKDHLEHMVAKYSLGRYTSDDSANVHSNALPLLKLLVTSGRDAEFHRLISWSIVRQLAGFGRDTDHFSLLPSLNIWYKCVLTVSLVMEAPLMGVYLLQGVNIDASGLYHPWLTFWSRMKHRSSIDCIQLHHSKVSKVDTLNSYSSENLADFLGSLVSHAAFSSLPERLRRVTVPGDSALNLTSEQLYFVSRCVIWCTSVGTVWRDHDDGSHAPYRARCNVPAMNMPSFGEAFNCAPGTKMNPVDKCVF
ncbi:hypothetical protein HPB50_021316 [Hyalomma asiaticum]|uniref:Uncharacterized protein n=1 Tax=Hyalomma asiaticum TaxID=266040 RepID=A0ACB7S8Q1_HYAAI|nr:hypothetical protein HPB50_021316 [Hyalomma asiaticum]